MSQSQESSASPFLLWVGNPIPAASLPALLGCRLDLTWSTAQLSSAKALILAQGGCRAQGISLQYEVGESRSLSRDPSVVRAWSCCVSSGLGQLCPTLPALLPAVTRGKPWCCGTAPGMAQLQPGWRSGHRAGQCLSGDNALGISC